MTMMITIRSTYKSSDKLLQVIQRRKLSESLLEEQELADMIIVVTRNLPKRETRELTMKITTVTLKMIDFILFFNFKT